MSNLSLYVHIPFCKARCRYCGFYSTSGLTKDVQDNYVKALLKELKPFLNQSFHTIYIGGGTPIYLHEMPLERLLDGIGPLTSKCIEYTVEANPCECSRDKISLLSSYGVNRISLGAQSFKEEELMWLGRRHDSLDFEKAWKLCRDFGFKNMNLDLMYGLKNQKVKDFEDNIQTALSFDPEHISLYQLNIEEGTPLKKEYPNDQYAVDENTGFIMYKTCHNILKDHGFEHYEISNYAKSGFESKHNLNYWDQGEYIGIGASASGYYENRRYTNIPDVDEYILRANLGKDLFVTSETLNENTKMEEKIFLGLRTNKGLDESLLYEKEKTVDAFIQSGLLYRKEGKIYPTVEGFLLNDEIALKLI